MPPADESPEGKSLQEVIDQLALYPPAAFEFIQLGLQYTVSKVHGVKGGGPAGSAGSSGAAIKESRHITGQQLSQGLREYAILQWGYLAQTVLRRWNILSTYDFGKIVFALVDHGFMKKTEQDSIEDFKDVFSFDEAFERSYRIGAGKMS